MKLIVQIPCFNEQETLALTVSDVPRQIPGVDEVEVLVIDDGSTDDTVAVTLAAGVDHIVRHTANQGLAAAFRTGIDAALRRGADLIVNTDADNQYPGEDIPRLIAPILNGDADFVVGDRQVAHCPHFSAGKRLLQRMGSFLVSRLSGANIPDAVSGFRAMSRDAAFKLNVVSTFSYTIETIIQAGNQKMRVTSVPIHTNATLRPSRLFKSMPRFLAKSGATMLRSFAMYRPLSVFLWIGFLLLAAGAIPVLRFLYLYAVGEGAGHIQSLVLGGVLVVFGGLALMLGIIADLIASNRRLIETVLEKVRRLEIEAENQKPATDDVDADDSAEVLHLT